ADVVAQHAPHFGHAAIGKAQILAGVDVLRPLADPGVVVARIALALLVGTVRTLAVEVRRAVADFGFVGHPARVVAVAEMPPGYDHGVGVVDRHDPAAQAAAPEIALAVRNREVGAVLGETRHHVVVDAQPDDVADASHIGVEIAVPALVKFD